MLGEMKGISLVSYGLLINSMLKELFIVMSGFDTFTVIIVGVYRVLDDEM
jgi:hypothetical protein